MDETLVEGQRTQVDVLLETETAAGRRPRLGLAPTDIVCRLKEHGSATWHEKKLDNLSWRDSEHGVHTLTIEPGDCDTADGLSVLLTGRAGLDPPIVPLLRTFRIAPPRPRFTATDLPCTTVCGRIMTLDHRPRVKAQLNFRVQQPPLAIGGIAVTGEQITVETDEKGYFEVDLVTGANVAVQIQAITYNRIIVVPPPPAPGIPVRLFSI
jgi:hypothetical protein